MHIYLYGPPGSGKTVLGQKLAEALESPFIDLDSEIERVSGKTIPQIFADEGEEGFRRRELEQIREVAGRASAVVALGGGALLNPEAREVVGNNGTVVFLSANIETLLKRARAAAGTRPLLEGDIEGRLRQLVRDRKAHYDTFSQRLSSSKWTVEDLVWQAQMMLGVFRVRGMGKAYDVRIDYDGVDNLGKHLRAQGLRGPVALVTDRNVGAIYLEKAVESLQRAGYTAYAFCIEPGESFKTMQTVMEVWDFFIQAGIDRGSTIVALGGGVVGDLTGYAASAFLRGVAWVNVPTTLLAMVDSSLGGKTGVDLPQAKNLVGAFYPPRLVLIQPGVLYTLPERELRGGLAEVIKHGVIGDPKLYQLCTESWKKVISYLGQIVRQGMAVKLKVIGIDPYEKGLRQALNLGHTIGHGVELVSGFRLTHGECVAIGMVAEARLAERLGLASAGLAQQLARDLVNVGLPVEIPQDLPREQILEAMLLDKKRAAGQVHFALPVAVGDVRTGVVVEDWQILRDVLVVKREE